MRGVRAFVVVGLVGCAGSLGCASSPHAAPQMAEIDRVRGGAAAREASELAPQAYAHAEEERAHAKQASDAGDDLAATLYADRAVAAYQHAFALARLARAERELQAANASLAAANEQATRLAASRKDVAREGDELEKKVAVVKEAVAPAASGAADPAREAARLVAARTLATEARLLCGAAKLVGGEAAGFGELDNEVTTLETQLAGSPRPAPIDAAARARAKCLDRLTTARRAATGAGDGGPDALLAEISAAGGFDPARDERGVVVTLRDAWKGAALVPAAEAKLKELGRIAAAHKGTGVQVVLHDAVAPSKADAVADRARVDAAAKALVAGGAPEDRVQAETAGNRAPVVDPANASLRARNARLEVVFVPPAR